MAASAAALPDKCARAPVRDQAVVTLITNNEGYPAGALAVAAALEVLDSKLRRIVLVTEDVTPGIQERRRRLRLRLRLHLRLRLSLSLDPNASLSLSPRPRPRPRPCPSLSLTPDARQELLGSASWEVVQVETIRCNQMLGPHVTADRYDLGAEYQQKKAKWLTTCTKFHVRCLPIPPRPAQDRPTGPSTPLHSRREMTRDDSR